MFVDILSFKFEQFLNWIAADLREESKMKEKTSMSLLV